MKDQPNTNLLTLVLFSITSVIYLLNAGWEYFYAVEKDTGNITTNIALAVMWFCIGLSFWNYNPKQK